MRTGAPDMEAAHGPAADRVSGTAETRGELVRYKPETAKPPARAGRCSWTGQARAIAIMNNDWRPPICRGGCNGLILHIKAD